MMIRAKGNESGRCSGGHTPTWKERLLVFIDGQGGSQ